MVRTRVCRNGFWGQAGTSFGAWQDGWVWVTGRAGEGLHSGQGLGVSTVWWGTVGMWAWHGPRLHVGKKVEVKLGVMLAFNSHPGGKGGKGRGEQRPLSMVSHP